MYSLITTKEEIQPILESCSYAEYCRLVPTLQKGMRRLQGRWTEEETLYGIPLTAEVDHPEGESPYEKFRIYTQKEVVMEGVEYEVIASYCDDTYDDRSNHRDEGDMQVVILGREKGAGHGGPLSLITGSYHYLNRGCECQDNFSMAGYPVDGLLYSPEEEGEEPEPESGPGLVFDSVVPFAEIVGQLVNRHPWCYTMDDMPQVYCVRSFKDALTMIAQSAHNAQT
jgi:hypothetical protein